MLDWLVVWVYWRTRLAQWTITDGLGFIPDHRWGISPEAYHHNFDSPKKDGSPKEKAAPYFVSQATCARNRAFDGGID